MRRGLDDFPRLTRLAASRLVAEGAQSWRRGFYRLVSDNSVSGRPKRSQPLHAVGRGRISIAESVRFGYFPSPHWLGSVAYVEARRATAEVDVREGTVINNNFTAIADRHRIGIGRDCLIGPNVTLLGSDFHALTPDARALGQQGESADIEIGSDVFIGAGVIILKGVTIGSGCVLGAGSVVSSDVLPGQVVSGGRYPR